MKILVDTHTHSISSGHAYSSLQEMAKEASMNGTLMFALTDHGPSMLGAPTLFHFGNLKAIPAVIYGVRVVKGVEANIIDFKGNTDMPDDYLKKLEFVIASLHEPCIEPGTIEENTAAFVNALRNPFIDAVGHPGNPQFEVDIDEVVKTALKYNKMIEINNHSFDVRKGSWENCVKFAAKCKEYGVRVVCGSDAHISFDIGHFPKVLKIFEEVGMPEELVLNTSLDKMEAYLKERKDRVSQH